VSLGVSAIAGQVLNLFSKISGRFISKLSKEAVDSGLIDPANHPKLVQLAETIANTDEEIKKEIASEMEAIMSFWLQYEGNPAEQSKVVQILRAIPRPFITLATTTYCIIWAIMHNGTFPSEQWYNIFLIIVSFYFCFRTAEKLWFRRQSR